MNVHTFFISGISESNIQKISSELATIEGSKPLTKDNSSGWYVFAAICPLSNEALVAKVASIVTGTGAHIVQTNVCIPGSF